MIATWSPIELALLRGNLRQRYYALLGTLPPTDASTAELQRIRAAIERLRMVETR